MKASRAKMAFFCFLSSAERYINGALRDDVLDCCARGVDKKKKICRFIFPHEYETKDLSTKHKHSKAQTKNDSQTTVHFKP
jgi:hypothetical protein